MVTSIAARIVLGELDLEGGVRPRDFARRRNARRDFAEPLQVLFETARPHSSRAIERVKVRWRKPETAFEIKVLSVFVDGRSHRKFSTNPFARSMPEPSLDRSSAE